MLLLRDRVLQQGKVLQACQRRKWIDIVQLRDQVVTEYQSFEPGKILSDVAGDARNTIVAQKEGIKPREKRKVFELSYLVIGKVDDIILILSRTLSTTHHASKSSIESKPALRPGFL
jgi:hypothetical protein